MNMPAEVEPAPSRTEEKMAARLETLDPGSKRHQVLTTALDFKRSWVRLARHLADVKRSGEFTEWGYKKFEAYAKEELHLRRDTARKLVRSYDFLASHESPRLQAAEHGGEPEPLPSYQAIDILAEARQNPYLSEDAYREIHDQVFRDDPPANVVRKLVRQNAEVPEKPKEDDRAARLRKALSLAERLYGTLLENEVPETITHSAEQVVGGLRRLLEE